MPLTSLVVPTDFSAGAQSALSRALKLPLGPKAKITLLHALPADIPGTLRDDAIREAHEALDKAIARVRAPAKERGVQLVAEVLEGSAATELVARAQELDAELIVMGRHGRRPLLDLVLGTTAQKIVRAAGPDVLLVHLPPGAPYQRPLVAVGLEKAAVSVVEAATRVAGDKVRYTLFHASNVPFEGFVTMSTPDRASYRQQFEGDAQRAFDALTRKLEGLDFVSTVRTGDPRELILEEAKRLDADLVVVGTHGKRGVTRLLVGSVAEWVLRHAPGDVLVAHA